MRGAIEFKLVAWGGSPTMTSPSCTSADEPIATHEAAHDNANSNRWVKAASTQRSRRVASSDDNETDRQTVKLVSLQLLRCRHI